MIHEPMLTRAAPDSLMHKKEGLYDDDADDADDHDDDDDGSVNSQEKAYCQRSLPFERRK
jgi:hypothetical protein